jgi:hypothetical protein
MFGAPVEAVADHPGARITARLGKSSDGVVINRLTLFDKQHALR